MEISAGIILGIFAWFLVRHGLFGFYVINQNERAVVTSFGRAHRLGGVALENDPVMTKLTPDERERYAFPKVKVIQPGFHFKFPWQRVHKVFVSTQTVSMAWDPENPAANDKGRTLEAVTKDHLNTGMTGQIRYRVSEQNMYAYLFGIKGPIVHVMGYFISVLREKIANFEAPQKAHEPLSATQGISINDLRKNLRDLNEHMNEGCAVAAARYGIVFEASLITGIDPPPDVESALAAINTAHNHVSSDISLAQAAADQKIVQSRKAVEIEGLRVQAEVEPVVALANELRILKQGGEGVLEAYIRNLRLSLLGRAKSIIAEWGVK